MNVLGYRSEDVQDLDGLIRYHQYRSLEDIVQDYFAEPAQIMQNKQTCGQSKELPRFIITSKLWVFVTWIADKFIANGA